MRARVLLGLVALAALPVATLPGDARADAPAPTPVEHEPIPADAQNDLAFGLRLDGDLPAAIETPSGLVVAPDPRVPPPRTTSGDLGPTSSLAGQNLGTPGASRFAPDTDVRRPDALPYTDPFIPSTAPWKRLAAFDKIDADSAVGYPLVVATPSLTEVPLHAAARGDGDDLFYGNVVLDVQPNELVRIPSVGPDARVVHARLGIGADDLDLQILRDSADNWFLRSHGRGRARLVYELAISRATFGGPMGDLAPDPRFVRWGSPLPAALSRDVDQVLARIGVPKATLRQTLATLVAYFRGFVESNDPLPPARSTYLALALAKKGVCRHRAYAFMVTATALGIRTRVVMNEAHAWVEVWDGVLWKRIDLGGAGTILDESAGEPAPDAPTYAPPPDPYDWPPGGTRGEDLGRTGSLSQGSAGSGGGAGGAGNAAKDPAGAPTPGTAGSPGTSGGAMTPDPRPITTVTLQVATDSASRGQELQVQGSLVAEGVPCAHTIVTVFAVDPNGLAAILGSVATDGNGYYSGSVVVPKSVRAGDYELVASTPGDARCGEGASP